MNMVDILFFLPSTTKSHDFLASNRVSDVVHVFANVAHWHQQLRNESCVWEQKALYAKYSVPQQLLLLTFA